MNKQEALERLAEQIKKCDRCCLHETRNHAVPGEGNPEAEIILIGEAPGKNEDLQGRPFIGAAGKLLNEALETIGLSREKIFITNIVKSRPPGNRDPLPEEVAACWPWLEKQIQIIQPKIIVLLGRHSLHRFFPEEKISTAHGKTLKKDLPKIGKVTFFSSYHPAAALYQRSLKETFVEDFKKIPKILELIKNSPDN